MTPLGLKAELARRSLREYVRLAWPIVEPQTPFTPGWHIDAICEHLEAVTRGEIRNLVICIPPRHMKSLAVAVFWPTWVWTSQPSTRWLFASYAASLSIRDSLKCRRLIESPWYRQAFGDAFHLSEDQNLKSRFDNDRGGFRIATSVGGAITGEGGDFICVDDPHNIVESESDIVRQGALDWWDQVMSTRANDPRTSRRVIVMQRVHESDLAGHVARQGGWEVLRLPAEFDGARTRTSIGWEDPRKEDGELLWPARFGKKEVDDLKAQLGSYGAAGQLQQAPAPLGGGLFKRGWFRYFTRTDSAIRAAELEVPMESLTKFSTCDLATSTRTSADYTVISTWGATRQQPQRLFLLDVVRRRLEGPDIVPHLRQALALWRPAYIGVESVGFQLAIVQQAVREGHPVREIKVDKDKFSRAMAATPLMEQGRVWFPAGAPWLVEIERELLTFPRGDHDDFVDTLSAAVTQLRQQVIAQVPAGYDPRRWATDRLFPPITPMFGNIPRGLWL